ncbi:uncharacterized protein L201_002194 [Kwoniella dendrophila CBS 6074]|uniref:MARVEL domain-containing protein n=1 Tax=Kwoniella dendrophila CBS 6074 TaxID=1295534 RepID=A0AAX4JQH6_9TREE
MSIIPLITTSLKGFTTFWALLLLAVSAAFIDKSNGVFGSGAVNNSNFAAGNALIAGSVFFLIYGCVSLYFIFRKPDNIFISVMVDTIMFVIFFIYFLASTAALSTEASFFSRWDSVDSWASLGNATVGLGWIMTFLVLAILLLEVIYTLMHFDRSYPTWRTPFNRLLGHGSTAKAAPAGISSAEMTAVPQNNVQTANATNTQPDVERGTTPTAPAAATPSTGHLPPGAAV